MKQKLLKLLKASIKYLQKVYDKYTTNDITETQTFHSLSPINNADVQHYSNALLWALKNRKKKNIRNIALTGPYGSGKSSILNTFREQNTNEDFKFLQISLATFKEEVPDKKNKTKNEDLLRLIELSILQQIFYHEEDKEIPDSRFKRIKSFKTKNLVLISIGVTILTLCTANLFFPKPVQTLFKLHLGETSDLVIHIISLIVFIVGSFIVILKSIRLVNSIKINKLKFHEAEIEIDENISKSILNNHLDEILYFFEVTPYTVVIIEDLDRFEQTEIFTKLRELNLLINNSKKVKREVVFLYAVRDDMFQDKDRTKFFDFIIPVIPVINSSNSNEKLIDIVKDNDYDISDDLIDDISLFIDDMRLLYNITNEYQVYHQQLDKKLNQDKLLAIIVYKNIHPNDFVLLSDSEGMLFSVFQNRSKFVKDFIEKLDEKIKGIKADIQHLETIKLKDVKELRMLYLFEYVAELGNFTSFLINGTVYKLGEATADAAFDYIIGDDLSYHHHGYNNRTGSYSDSMPTAVTLKFADIEKKVDPNHTYQQRQQQINDWNNKKTEILKEQIKEIEKEKSQVKHLKLKEIIAEGNVKVETENIKQNLLLNILLRSGYIDEDYLDYISIFYPGSITKEDRQFLLNVKSQIQLSFDFKLNKIDKLIPKISPVDFERSYILNYNLLDYILLRSGYNTHQDSIFHLLKNQSDNSIAFIDGFIDDGVNTGLFIKQLANKWENIWTYIISESTYTKERKDTYYKLLIQHAEVKDLLKISEKSDLKSIISQDSDFLNVIPNIEKLKNVIKSLVVKFEDLNLVNSPTQLVDFIYQGSYYKISQKMVERVIQAKGEFNRVDFDNKNFYAIQNSKAPKLIEYLTGDIDTYISEVYLNMEFNTEENEGSLIELLNDENLSIEHKTEIIDKSNTKITDLSDTTFTEVDQILLSKSKVKPHWQNLIDYYHNIEDQFDEAMVTFIDNDDNANILAGEIINTDTPNPDEETVEKFIISLINQNDLSDSSYSKILESIETEYDELDFKEIPDEKVKLLIEEDLINLTTENYTSLKELYDDAHILLLEKRHTEFIKAIAEYELTEPEVYKLLSSTILSAVEKNKIVDSLDETMIFSNGRLRTSIGRLCLTQAGFKVSITILKDILIHSLSTDEKLILFNSNYKEFDKSEITEILSAFPHPYSDIAVNGKRPLLDFGQENTYLANNLKSVRYISKAENEKKGIRISTFRK